MQEVGGAEIQGSGSGRWIFVRERMAESRMHGLWESSLRRHTTRIKSRTVVRDLGNTMADPLGFEPRKPDPGLVGLANRCLQPLDHGSMEWFEM